MQESGGKCVEIFYFATMMLERRLPVPQFLVICFICNVSQVFGSLEPKTLGLLSATRGPCRGFSSIDVGYSPVSNLVGLLKKAGVE